MICIDASVAAKWLIAEGHSAQADALLRGALERQEPMVAPPLLTVEITNILRQRIRRGMLNLATAQALLTEFLAVPITLIAHEALASQALVLATEHNLSAVYDAQYLALSELTGATLWTADRRLVNALGHAFPFVRWIGHYPEPIPGG